MVRQATSLSGAPTSKILEGKTGTEKQKQYAEKLVQMAKNTIVKRIELRNKFFKENKTELQKISEISNERIRALKTKSYKELVKKERKDLNESIKTFTSKLKKIKKYTTYGQVINTLS